MRALWLGAAVSLATAGLLQSSPSSSPSRSLDAVGARMKASVNDGNTPSLVAAVGRGDRIIWRAAFGYADRARQIPATAATPYSVASVSKPFTATAVMILHERGLVGLDEPVTRYVGPLERPGVVRPDGVTVRRTLRHVAGFPTHYQFFFDDGAVGPLPFGRTLACHGAEVAAPGSRYVYSNLGFGVLSEVVERASGQPYAAFLRRDVLEPLGLAHAGVATAQSPVAGAAVRYGGDGAPLPFYVTDHPGASDVFASADDLVRFGLFHAGAWSPTRTVLTAASRDAMQQAGPGGYGLGWNVNPDWNGRRVAWHSGAMPGVSATLWTVPGEGVAVAVLANQFGAPVNQFAGELLAATLGVTVPSGGGTARRDESAGRDRAEVAPASDVRGRWVGSLSTCPTRTDVAFVIGDRSDVAITVAGAPAETPSASVSPARVSGSFSVPGSMGPTTFRFDLRPRGDRLEGTVLRTTSLGPRGNVAVTLWVELRRPDVR
jgi:CubicO group peptidase (beta-lactamase class C family)